MITTPRRLRCLKRQILILCFLTICTVWLHHVTSVRPLGSNVYKFGKATRRFGSVYDWARRIGQQAPNRTNAVFATDANDAHSSIPSSHPFDNQCQYPVLNPDDENLRHVTKHIRIHVCKRVQPELLSFDYDRGLLIFNRSLADRLFADRKLRCQYRSIAGAIRPRITDILPTSNWTTLTRDIAQIRDDIIETKCFALQKLKNATVITALREIEVFRYSFGHVVKRNRTADKKSIPYLKNDESTVSVDFLFLDSTALNVMKRHMPKTWKYMKEVMQFYHLEGYTKVGDNSMVNLMPILAGLRYGSQASDMLTEVPDNKALEAEPLPFFWKFFKEKGCATMFNDDVADHTRGFLNYPWSHFKGFAEYPTDHFTRPWHIYNRRYPLANASKFCFGNYPYYKLQLNFLEQFIKKYRDICHFSFNFITELSHDDPNNLEMADDHLQSLLERLYTGGYFNNTILFIMGDHGNRIGLVMYSYVGRIEERMSLFSVYFPDWYRRKHPDAMRQLEINKHRLTSNYDVHRMLKEIFNNTLSDEKEPAIDRKLAVSKAISLFRPIPTNRTCPDANIPPPHCVCLEPVPPWSPTVKLPSKDAIYRQASDLILNWTRVQLESVSANCSSISDLELLSTKFLTTSQMIQHGVRDMSPDQTKKLQKKLDGDIEYLDVIYRINPIRVTARARLQYFKKLKRKLVINIPPYFYPDGSTDRSRTIMSIRDCEMRNSTATDTRRSTIPWFCQCLPEER